MAIPLWIIAIVLVLVFFDHIWPFVALCLLVVIPLAVVAGLLAVVFLIADTGTFWWWIAAAVGAGAVIGLCAPVIDRLEERWKNWHPSIKRN